MHMSLQNIVKQTQKTRARDKELWENMPDDECQVCGIKGEDRRSLIIGVGYDLKEVSQKFFDLTLIFHEPCYGLRMCKGCRAALMQKLREWLAEQGRMKFGNLDEDGIVSFRR